MKNYYRISIVLAASITILSGVLFGDCVQVKAADTYYLHRIYYWNGTDYCKEDEPYSGRLRYEGWEVYISGEWERTDEWYSCADYGASDGGKLYDQRLEVSRKCKVVEIEMPVNQVTKWKKRMRDIGLQKGDEIPLIEAVLEIKDGKIVRIYTYA